MHPSQEAAARSLGLTRPGAPATSSLPQAVRRVIPPLLNDFIGLQKDTALVGSSARGGVQAIPDRGLRRFNSPVHRAARLFVAITIPLARFTDWLVARDAAPRRRRRGSRGRARVLIEGLHKSFGKHEVLRGIDLSSPSTRSYASSALPAPASQRSCAASTCSSRSTPAASWSRRGDHGTRSRREPRSAAGSGSSSRPSTSSRT